MLPGVVKAVRGNDVSLQNEWSPESEVPSVELLLIMILLEMITFRFSPCHSQLYDSVLKLMMQE